MSVTTGSTSMFFLFSIITWLLSLAGLVLGIYVLYLLVKALRIYIRKNS